MATLPKEILATFDVSPVDFVEQTGIAQIWKVRRATGDLAALKLYKRAHMGNEATGFAFLEAHGGEGVARVYQTTENAALLEWLPGPSLGDWVRSGRDTEAAKTLVQIANLLHRTVPTVEAKLPTLETWFEDLRNARILPSCPPSHAAAFASAQRIASELCANQVDIRPLHGDLHHDNILETPRGPLAFDAKGVLGERTYELANAFRNPKGASAIVADPNRVRHLRDTWSQAFAVSPRRLMQWAVAKCALSIAWTAPDGVGAHDGLPLLEIFQAVLDDTP